MLALVRVDREARRASLELLPVDALRALRRARLARENIRRIGADLAPHITGYDPVIYWRLPKAQRRA